MTSHRIARSRRSDRLEISFNGTKVEGYDGETVATCLLAAGFRSFGKGGVMQAAGRVYCAIGTCLQCVVTVDGERGTRACQTAVRPGMNVETDS